MLPRCLVLIIFALKLRGCSRQDLCAGDPPLAVESSRQLVKGQNLSGEPPPPPPRGSLWSICEAFKFIEHYAGKAAMTETMRASGVPSARLDVEYHRGMDMLTSGGFASSPQCKSRLFLVYNDADPRTYLASILKGSTQGFACWKGVKCSTWVSICRATTLRSFFNPCGLESLACVRQGNLMAAREALSCLLVHCLMGVFVIEQPSTSLLFRHPRLQWLCDRVNATSSISFAALCRP